MSEAIIRKYLKTGRLRQQKAGLIQVEGLLRQAMLDLNEANKIVAIAERATYVLAYMAMLKAGRALLLYKGYVPDDGAQHKTVVEVTAAMLGNEYKNIAIHFEIMRRKRNELTYDASVLTSPTESKKALSDAIVMVKGILKEVKASNPQIELKFKIS